MIEATRSVRRATSTLKSCILGVQVEVMAIVGGAMTSTILLAMSARLARSVVVSMEARTIWMLEGSIVRRVPSGRRCPR